MAKEAGSRRPINQPIVHVYALEYYIILAARCRLDLARKSTLATLLVVYVCMCRCAEVSTKIRLEICGQYNVRNFWSQLGRNANCYILNSLWTTNC